MQVMCFVKRGHNHNCRTAGKATVPSNILLALHDGKVMEVLYLLLFSLQDYVLLQVTFLIR